MNILVLNYEYPPLGGGAAPVCRDLAEFYARHGHQTEVITMAFRGLPRREVVNGVAIRRVWALRKRQATCETPEMLSYVASAFPGVLRRLWSGRYDAIHCHFVVPTGLLAYAATRFARTPYIVTVHGSDIPGYNPERFTREHQYLRPVLRVILGAAAAITAPSEFMRGLVREHVGEFPVDVIPNAVDSTMFTPRPKQRRILMSGRLLARKGFADVLEALRGLDTDYEVHVAGDGPQRAALEALARELNTRVVFHGWLEQHSAQWRELYETSSILCLVSEMENSPVSLLEGMLAGMAVVTSNVSGCPEIVGDAGLTVAPHDIADIRAALHRLISDDAFRENLAQRARHRALAQYSLERIGARYLELLESCVKKART